MDFQPPRLVNDLRYLENIWIYNWDDKPTEETLFAIDCRSNSVISYKLCHPFFVERYNHVIVITRNVKLFEARIRNLSLSKKIFNDLRVQKCNLDVGYIINRNFSPDEIKMNRNVGVAFRIYCRNAKDLHNMLSLHSKYYKIEAIGRYKNTLQCFFDEQRSNIFRKNNAIFNSRGLFRVVVKKNSNIPQQTSSVDEIELGPNCYLEYIDKEQNFTTYLRITCFQMNIDDSDGSVISCNFRNIIIYPGSKQQQLIHLTRKMRDEKTLIRNILEFLYCTEKSGEIIIGWNVNQRDYIKLMEKINVKITFRDDKTTAAAIIPMPPWKLCLDISEYKSLFQDSILKFPSYNPPSNDLISVCKAFGFETDDDDDDATFLLSQFTKKTNLVNCSLCFLNLADQSPTIVVQRQNNNNNIIISIGECYYSNLSFSIINKLSISTMAVMILQNFFQSVIMSPLNKIYRRYGERGEEEEEEEKKKKRRRRRRRKGGREKIPGGHVIEPVKGMHRGRNIGVLDFNSIYPYIMLNFGIIKGNVCRIPREEYSKRKHYYDEHFVASPWKDNTSLRYLSVKEVSKNNPIRVFCEYLIAKRVEYRNTSPAHSQCFKILINSIYGLYSCQRCHLYCPISATLITKYAAYYLREAVDFFITKFPGTDCLYGDTDSLFLANSQYDIQQMAFEYNKQSPPFLKLKVEANFEKLILIRKKMYLGKFNKNNSGYKISGFPFHLPYQIYNLMINCLYAIVDNYDSDTKLLTRLLENIFQKFISENLAKSTEVISYLEVTLDQLFDFINVPRLSTYFYSGRDKILREYRHRGYIIIQFSKISPTLEIIGRVKFTTTTDVEDEEGGGGLIISSEVKNALEKIIAHFTLSDDDLLLLYATLRKRNDDKISLTLNDTRNSPQFSCLLDVDMALRTIGLRRHHHHQSVELIIGCNEKYLLPLLCFIFNRTINWSETNEKKYLYLLPTHPEMAIVDEEKIFYLI